MSKELVLENGVTIMQGSRRDLPELVGVNQCIFTGVYDVEPYTLENYKTRLQRTRPLILIARDGDTIAGDSIAFPHDNAFYIWVIGVAERYRGQGIASKLFEMNEAYAREHGYDVVTTKVYSTSKEMVGLIQKLGYSVVKFHHAKDPNRNFYYRIRKSLSREE